MADPVLVLVAEERGVEVEVEGEEEGWALLAVLEPLTSPRRSSTPPLCSF